MLLHSALGLTILRLLAVGVGATPTLTTTGQQPNIPSLISSSPIVSNATPSGLPRLQPVQHVQTDTLLNVGYYEGGPSDGEVVILVHGNPYGIDVYVDVVPGLIEKGYRVIVPYIRGFGETTFLHPDTYRSSEQAALGSDLLSLMDALHIKKAILAGFDWGTVVVNVVAALWPERVSGMVAANSYLIENRDTAWVPSSPESESTKWYYYLFLTPVGYSSIALSPKEMARVLWEKNTYPAWNFTEADLDRAAIAFDNPDYVDVVVNFYRIRLLYAPGDPRYTTLAEALDKQPPISVPSVTLDPTDSVIFPPTNGSSTAQFFTGPRVHHIIPNCGENIPQQAPQAFIDAIVEVATLC